MKVYLIVVKLWFEYIHVLQVEFMAEDELIYIIPNVRMDTLHMICVSVLCLSFKFIVCFCIVKDCFAIVACYFLLTSIIDHQNVC